MNDIRTGKRKRSEVVDAEEFLTRLRKHMDEKGLSQAELADRADLSRSTMTMFFSGQRKPSADAVVKLAAILDVSTDYLLGRCGESEINDLMRHEKVIGTVKLFVQLSPKDQERVIEMIRLLVNTAPHC